MIVDELRGFAPIKEYWPALARLAWNTMLSLQYLGSRSHKIQPLQASLPWCDGMCICNCFHCL